MGLKTPTTIGAAILSQTAIPTFFTCIRAWQRANLVSSVSSINGVDWRRRRAAPVQPSPTNSAVRGAPISHSAGNARMRRGFTVSQVNRPAVRDGTATGGGTAAAEFAAGPAARDSRGADGDAPPVTATPGDGETGQ